MNLLSRLLIPSTFLDVTTNEAVMSPSIVGAAQPKPLFSSIDSLHNPKKCAIQLRTAGGSMEVQIEQDRECLSLTHQFISTRNSDHAGCAVSSWGLSMNTSSGGGTPRANSPHGVTVATRNPLQLSKLSPCCGPRLDVGLAQLRPLIILEYQKADPRSQRWPYCQ